MTLEILRRMWIFGAGNDDDAIKVNRWFPVSNTFQSLSIHLRWRIAVIVAKEICNQVNHVIFDWTIEKKQKQTINCIYWSEQRHTKRQNAFGCSLPFSIWNKKNGKIERLNSLILLLTISSYQQTWNLKSDKNTSAVVSQSPDSSFTRICLIDQIRHNFSPND